MQKVILVSITLQACVRALMPQNRPVAPEGVVRRDLILSSSSMAAALFSLPVVAAETASTPAPVADAPPAVAEFPTDWGLTQDYYTDAAKVVAHMRLVRIDMTVPVSKHGFPRRQPHSTRVPQTWRR